MRKIELLSPDVAEKIAAGEVIERPASVIKELVENALDAGATEVAVILEQGGKSLIEVLDNGHGIPAGELALAVERHATSKIREVSDLERLNTLGFRGEALPSIRAVAELSIVSRARGAASAHEWKGGRLEALTFGHFLGSEHGSRVRAMGLFSQIPARLKFLKSQAAEVAQVREWIERLALTHPATGFRLVSDERTILNLRPQSEEDRVRAILADGEDYPLVSAQTDLGLGAPSGVRVRAHWLQGVSLPQMRKVVQIVNGRAVRDRLVQQAALHPFRQALLPGQFPAIALFVELDPSLIDVNVHPSKTEVRFLRSRDVFTAIEGLVQSMIDSHGAPAFVAQAAHEQLLSSSSSAWSAWENRPRSEPTNWLHPEANSSPERLQESFAPVAPHPLSEARYVGTMFNTYLVYDLGTEAALVDQHAAHERIRFEKLRAQMLTPGSRPAPQALLLPEAVRFAADSRIALESRLPWFAELGFECDIFGEESLLFRAIPSAWGTDDLRTRLKSLVERVLDSERPTHELDEALFEKLASEACHSSIRAGDALSPEQSRALVDDLFRCQHPWNCPHGRPTVARVPRGRFEEWFQRRV